jgi:glucosamine--fructose-6-phosphate aminotransferase (isomerizing)
VHNGIIENYLSLRAELREAGCTFTSETDTEVLSHLVNREVVGGANLADAVRKALLHVQGSWAVAVLSVREPDRIVVARNQSPLVVGMGSGEMLVASDIPALLGFSQDVVIVEDGQMGVVTAGEYRAFDVASGLQVQARMIRVDMTPAMAEKGGFKHFMLKEIHEQPRALIDTMRGRVSVERGEILFEDEGPSADVLASVQRVHLAACGTSHHAALVGRYLLTTLAGIPVEVHLASEYDPAVALLHAGELFVSVSQSGETLDTLRTQRDAKAAGARTLAICNVVASSLARDADHVIHTHAGPEISVASTKAFTTQIVTLYLLALAIGRARGVLEAVDVQRHVGELLTVPGLMDEALRENVQIRMLARRYQGFAHMLFLGRGLLHPVALEGALKLKEISYIHAEGYSAGEMKHGPIALIDENFPTVVLAPRGPWYARTVGNLEEVRARGGRLLAMISTNDLDLAERADDIMRVPACPPLLVPLVATILLQLLAYHVADLKGTDVDQPRNLAKSVTVE